MLSFIIKTFLSESPKEYIDSNIKNVLVVRQHNQFGDLLASVSLFRAIKEKYTNCKLTVIVSPQNFYGITKNKFIDEYFVYDQKKIFNPIYFSSLVKILRNKYDLTIVPATVSISSTSCILAGLSNSNYKVGPAKLEKRENKLKSLFHKSIELNWLDKPERHVADFGQDIIRPLGFYTKNLESEISFDENDNEIASNFLRENDIKENDFIVGLHIGAGKPPNRWAVKNFIELINKISSQKTYKLLLTGSNSDIEQFNEFEKLYKYKFVKVINKSIPVLAAIISKCNLFITNDTGVMHVAGATKVNQISLFGPTNPNNWAPIGKNKKFIKKDDNINSVTVEEVYKLSLEFLG